MRGPCVRRGISIILATVGIACISPGAPWCALGSAVPVGDEPPTVQSGDRPLERVVLASCHRQRPDAVETSVDADTSPIWDPITAAGADLLVWLGDNIYGDIRVLPGVFAAPTETQLRRSYANLLATRPYVRAVSSMRFPPIATWDDHDAGLNDGGAAEVPDFSEEAFRDFVSWRPGVDPLEAMGLAGAGRGSRASVARPDLAAAYRHVPDMSHRKNGVAAGPGGSREGVYSVHVFGPRGKRVRFILLDSRSFKEGGDPLGPAQWRWLELVALAPLPDGDTPAFTFIGAGTQITERARTIGEAWGRGARSRLFDTIARLRVPGVVLMSGDVHFGEISATGCTDGAAVGYGIVEVTTSGITHSLLSASGGGLKMKLLRALLGVDNFVRTLDAAVPGIERVGKPTWEHNYAQLEFSWDLPSPRVKISLRGDGGVIRQEMIVHAANLVADRNAAPSQLEADEALACAAIHRKIADHNASGAFERSTWRIVFALVLAGSITVSVVRITFAVLAAAI